MKSGDLYWKWGLKVKITTVLVSAKHREILLDQALIGWNINSWKKSKGPISQENSERGVFRRFVLQNCES